MSSFLIGLLQVGDRIFEVNGEMVDNMSPADLQAMLVSSLFFFHYYYLFCFILEK